MGWTDLLRLAGLLGIVWAGWAGSWQDALMFAVVFVIVLVPRVAKLPRLVVLTTSSRPRCRTACSPPSSRG